VDRGNGKRLKIRRQQQSKADKPEVGMSASKNELSRADLSTIRSLFSEVERLVSARDYPGWSNRFTPDAVFMFAHSRTAHGRAAIEQWGRDGPKVNRLTFSHVEIHACGDGMAWATSGYELAIEGQPAADIGKQLVLFERQTDGSWLCCACSASSDLPPPAG
jgi:ketosteroid isomerase-like protein